LLITIWRIILGRERERMRSFLKLSSKIFQVIWIGLIVGFFYFYIVFNQLLDNSEEYSKNANYWLLSIGIGIFAYILYVITRVAVAKYNNRNKSFKRAGKEGLIGFVVCILGLIIGSFALDRLQGFQSKPSPTPTPLEFNTDTIFNLVNEWRVSQKLAPFKKKDGLCDAAKIRIYEIERNWSHEGFEYSRIKRFSGYASAEFGENLADFISGTEEDVLNGWLNSPEHLKNIKDNFVYTCVISDGGHVVELLAK